MGIKPTGGTPINIPADNVQSRWGAWEAELSGKGDVAGEVLLDTWSLADSANKVAKDAIDNAQDAIDEGNRLNDELGALIDKDGTDPLNLWRIQEQINESNSDILAMHDLWITQIRGQLQEQVEANKSRVNVAFVSDYGCSHPDVTYEKLNPGWRVTIPSANSMLHVEYYNMNDPTTSGGSLFHSLQPTTEYFWPPSGVDREASFEAANRLAKFTWAAAPIRVGASKVYNSDSFSPTRLVWETVSEHTVTPNGQARQFAALWKVMWANVNRGSTYRARIVTSGGTVLAEWGSSSIGPWSPLGDGRYTMAASCQGETIPDGQDVLFQVYTSGDSESQREIAYTDSNVTWIEDV